jgi:hypothetical protein
MLENTENVHLELKYRILTAVAAKCSHDTFVPAYQTTLYHPQDHRMNFSCRKMSNLTIYVPSHHSIQALTDFASSAPQQIAYLLCVYP